MGSLPNGVNNQSLDLPDFTPGNLNLNHDPRNGLPYFNTSLFTPNALGTPGTASRRSFHGPGMVNFDLALLRTFRLGESKSLQFRLETFNTFNHTQFFGPVAVDGDIDSALFGQAVRNASPRLVQAALKFTFWSRRSVPSVSVPSCRSKVVMSYLSKVEMSYLQGP